MKRWWIWAIAVLVALATLGGFAVGRRSQAQSKDTPKIEQSKMSPEQEERQKIQMAAMEIGKLKRAEKSAEGWTLAVEETSQEANFQMVFKDAAKFFAGLDRAKIDVSDASFTALTDSWRDVYGNKLKDLRITYILLKRQTFERIDWQGFEPTNFPKVADDIWLHPKLEEQMQKKKQQQQQQGGQQGGQTGGGGGGQQGAGGGGT